MINMAAKSPKDQNALAIIARMLGSEYDVYLHDN